MEFGLSFFISSISLGAGLAMDAFSVSLANGLNEPYMKKRKVCLIAGTFAFFQALMPTVGWICVHTVVSYFKAFEKFIPWIALILLGFIGGKMLMEGLRNGGTEEHLPQKVGLKLLIAQGIATSIDALSVGLQTFDYTFFKAIVSSLIIAAVTYIICTAGVYIGKKFGTKLANKANILGGVILIAIGIEIFITGLI